MTYLASLSTALILFASTELSAQSFTDLSTTDDGTTLYFSSPVRPRGEAGTFYSKIYQWNADTGVRLLAEVKDPGDYNGCKPDNFYQLTAPQVSQDRFVRGWNATRPVLINRGCPVAEATQGILIRGALATALPGPMTISPNGRFAVTVPYAASESLFHVVTDTDTGIASEVAGAFRNAPQTVTNDGSVVRTETKAIVLTSRSGETRLFRTNNYSSFRSVIIDADGRFIYYTIRLGPDVPSTISQIDVATGRITEIDIGYEMLFPMVPRDGRKVFYYSFQDSTVRSWDGQAVRIVNQTPKYVTGATVSGDGRVIYAVLNGSAIIRIDIESGVSTEVIANAPFVASLQRSPRSIPDPYRFSESYVAPAGGLLEIHGSSLLATSQVTLCGREATVISPGYPDQLQLIVPDDTPPGSCELVVSGPALYEHGIQIEIRSHAPDFASRPWRDRRLPSISADNPAVPGEVISIDVTGLGVRASEGILDPGFACRLAGSRLDVTFAPSIYPRTTQLSFRIPDESSSSYYYLECGWLADDRDPRDIAHVSLPIFAPPRNQ